MRCLAKGVLSGQLGVSRVFALWLALLLVGCGKDHAENKNTDNSYIRAPGEAAEIETMPSGELLPAKKGRSWTWKVTTIRRFVEKGELRTEPVSREIEELVCTGPITIEGQETIGFETRKEGKLIRMEMFGIHSDRLLQVASGLSDKVAMKPPLVLLRYPIKDGADESWTGVLHYMKATVPGAGYSRVSGREKVKTAAGEFPSWRVDSIISTTINGQAVSFPVSRWLSPGVGMVRQRLYVGNLLVEKELQSYSGG